MQKASTPATILLCLTNGVLPIVPSMLSEYSFLSFFLEINSKLYYFYIVYIQTKILTFFLILWLNFEQLSLKLIKEVPN